MPPVIRYGVVRDPQEMEQLRRVLTQCFNFPARLWQPYVTNMRPENFRSLTRGKKLVGGLGIYFAGQWFGGRSVPTGGIAAVGVPPEERGTGTAFDLMTRTLRELRKKKVPLSTLYPATQRLYRKVGYEQAGSYCRHVIQAAQIGSFPRELPVEAVEATDHAAFREPYRQRAMRTAGNLDRSQVFWNRLSAVIEEPVYAYLFGPRDAAQGYVVYTQQKGDPGTNLAVRDLVAVTPAAVRTAWAFLAGHRSIIREISWYGPAMEPLTAVLPEQSARIALTERWFLRIVDVAAALKQRGYPAGVEGELLLDVKDEVLPENQGRHWLMVAGGGAEVKAARPSSGRKPAPRLRLHVRALASLYSGFLTPAQLVDLGWIEGDPAALETASRIFAGPEPWMPDGF